MNFEQSKETPKTTESTLALRKQMQVKLAERFYGFVSDEKMLEWIERNGAQFARIVVKEPAILDKFKNMPEATLEEVERDLYIPHLE